MKSKINEIGVVDAWLVYESPKQMAIPLIAHFKDDGKVHD